MTIPTEYSFARYLAAKKTVDDRALNRPVWDTLARALPEGPLRVLEIGAGIGTMIERALEWGLLVEASYTAVDASAENIAAAHQRLWGWAEPNGFQVTETAGGVALENEERQVTVDLVTADVFDFIAQERPARPYDVLIAHAVLDLMDIRAALPQFLGLLKPGGLFYFTINFDGGTYLEPAIDPVFDDHIQAMYHRTMDERLTDGKPSGDSRAGRHLFRHLKEAGAEILAAGASDWVVFPGAQGYPADEAYFLHYIIHTMGTALTGHPELDREKFSGWHEARHEQIEARQLVYIAHQIDFVGTRAD